MAKNFGYKGQEEAGLGLLFLAQLPKASSAAGPGVEPVNMQTQQPLVRKCLLKVKAQAPAVLRGPACRGRGGTVQTQLKPVLKGVNKALGTEQ